MDLSDLLRKGLVVCSQCKREWIGVRPIETEPELSSVKWINRWKLNASSTEDGHRMESLISHGIALDDESRHAFEKTTAIRDRGQATVDTISQRPS